MSSLYQKYRSKTFGEMVGQSHIIATILESIKNDQLTHAYLLTGPRGIGKTSTARLLAKAINCQSLAAERKDGGVKSGEPCNNCESCQDIAAGRAVDVIEIDAASHTGVDDVRELIENSRLAPAKGSKKVYIIDEVHMLSKSAFNALLKTLEEPPSHVVFIMATTEVHKIPATILSRALRFDFKRATKKDLISNLQRVAKAENIVISEEALDLIAVLSAGGHRDALGLLEKVSVEKREIDRDITEKLLGVTSEQTIYDFVGAIFNKSTEEGLKIVHQVFEGGADMSEFNRGVIELLRKTLLVSVTKTALFEDTSDHLEKIAELTHVRSVPEIISLINIFVEAGNLLKEV
ncbi:MAG TPA: DNA polymerase III subunit gamma/tau, partial [bacterium]|nr:DNA polymerase III subunit gamma/tau [bacterium]